MVLIERESFQERFRLVLTRGRCYDVAESVVKSFSSPNKYYAETTENLSLCMLQCFNHMTQVVRIAFLTLRSGFFKRALDVP